MGRRGTTVSAQAQIATENRRERTERGEMRAERRERGERRGERRERGERERRDRKSVV